MTSPRWEEIKAVVAGAMDTPPSERHQYLERVCGDNSELRHQAESLLVVADGGSSVPGARAAVDSARDHLAGDADASLRTALERALGRQYEILRALGSGGMGTVFLARERTLDRLVAVKVLRPDLAEAADARERFRREARIAAQLSHPGILPLHASGEIDGIWYFVMGYVRGQSLAERLRLEGRLPPRTARQILIELADAVDCAHRHGVVHRDIKPSNILLDDESGRAILADFGISKLTGAGDSLTVTGLVVGSPHFMSPEQGLGSADVDERSDLYSLGAVGYTMLAGCEPFAGASASELTYRRLSQDPPPLNAVAPSVPEDLALIIMRCLARDPELRWGTAREVRDALGRTSVDSTDVLPEGVRDLPSFGPYAIVWAVAWSLLAFLAVRGSRERALMLLVALLVPVGLVLHVWNAGHDGLRPRDIARIALWPPEWWGMWWPSALRRPTDLWKRLPWQARLVRVTLTAFLLGLPATILARHWLFGGDGALATGERDAMFAVAEGVLVVGAAAVVAIALWWTHRRALSLSEGTRLLFGATSPAPAWNTPQMARLLRPEDGAVRPPDRDAPVDHRRAIGELVRLLPNEAAATGAEVVRVTECVFAAIEQCDQELGALTRDAGPAEIDRLTAQLASFQAVPGGESSDRQALRALVEHQLELVRRMHQRHERVSERRAHLFYLMRGLWAQLCLWRNALDGEPAGVIRSRNQVRRLCAEIDREVQDETRELVR